MGRKWDFSGWATKNDILCSDGRTIRHNAFRENDGQTVPIVWQHQHNSPDNVLGHMLLENRDEGVYGYGAFNETEMGQQAKELVQHGDITSLSIYANQLQQRGGDVYHGNIREVSLVLAGANIGAVIDNPILEHSDGTYGTDEEEGIIYTGLEGTLVSGHPIQHADDTEKGGAEQDDSDDGDETIQDVFDTLNDKQKKVVYFLIGQAVENAKGGNPGASKGGDEEAAEHFDFDEGEENTMKYNVFDQDGAMQHNGLTMDETSTILGDAKRLGSLKESFLSHADTYGIQDIETLFPEPTELNTTPEWIKRNTDWVSVVMSGVHHSPFSRVKTRFADITADEARARGYIKGNLKKEEVFTLLKRSTDPQTVYKKQKLDRDDVIDITDFDVVTWIKGEMRMMLDEELARAFLWGDGRLSDSEDKIQEIHIRPICKDTDADLFAFNIDVPYTSGTTTADDFAKAVIKKVIKGRKDYRGSGNPTLFTTEDMLSDWLLLEDQIGHPLYETESALATKLRVSRIVTVPDEMVPEGIVGVIVNLKDYTVGADKGGAVSMFDDFDIDYNQMKYLIETRCSGALTKPKSAMVIRKVTG